MKKKLIFSIFICFLLTSQVFAAKYEQQGIKSNLQTTGGVICNKKMTRCSIGSHTMHSSSTRKPLFVLDGVVCNYKKTTCTNGFTYIHSTKPIY